MAPNYAANPYCRSIEVQADGSVTFLGEGGPTPRVYQATASQPQRREGNFESITVPIFNGRNILDADNRLSDLLHREITYLFQRLKFAAAADQAMQVSFFKITGWLTDITLL